MTDRKFKKYVEQSLTLSKYSIMINSIYNDIKIYQKVYTERCYIGSRDLRKPKSRHY